MKKAWRRLRIDDQASENLMYEDYNNRLATDRVESEPGSQQAKSHYWRAGNAMFDERHAARMRPYGWAVWTCLLRYVNHESGLAWPSVARISSQTGMSRRKVTMVINQLIGLGYVAREAEGGYTSDGSGRTARYRVHMEPIAGGSASHALPLSALSAVPGVAHTTAGSSAQYDDGVAHQMRTNKTNIKNTKRTNQSLFAASQLSAQEIHQDKLPETINEQAKKLWVQMWEVKHHPLRFEFTEEDGRLFSEIMKKLGCERETAKKGKLAPEERLKINASNAARMPVITATFAAYLADDDWYVAKENTHSLAVLKTKIKKYEQAGATGGVAGTRPKTPNRRNSNGPLTGSEREQIENSGRPEPRILC